MEKLVKKINTKYDRERFEGGVPGESENRTQFRQILEGKIKEKLDGVKEGAAFILAHELTLRFFLNLEYENGNQTILDEVEKVILGEGRGVQESKVSMSKPEKKVTKPSTEEGKMAFVFLLIRDDKYLPGVIATAYGLRKHGTKHDLVLLYTSDVPPSAIKILRDIKLFDQIKKTLYIEQNISSEITGYYGEWIIKTATKWQALRLSQYKKILFMDIDMLIIDNIDDVFNIEFPTAVFASTNDARTKRIFKIPDTREKSVTFKQGMGVPIKDEDVLTALKSKDGLAFNGGTVGIIPSAEYYKEMLTINKKGLVTDFEGRNGPDEKLIAYLYAQDPNVVWHNLSYVYNFIVNRPDLLLYRENGLVKWKRPKVLHYIRKTKPWNDSLIPGTTPLASNILWMRYFLEALQKYNLSLESMKYYLSKGVYDFLGTGLDKLVINLDVFDQKYNPWMFDAKIESVVSQRRGAYTFKYSPQMVGKIIEATIKLETLGSGIDKVVVVTSLDEDVTTLRESGLFNDILTPDQVKAKYDKTVPIDLSRELTKTLDYEFRMK